MQFKSLSEAAAYARVCRQAIFLAIQKGSLKAEKCLINGKTRWVIAQADLDAYRASKYNRDKRVFQGQRLFDLSESRWSVLHAHKVLSQMLGRPYPAHHIYYLIRKGELHASKRANAWIVSRDEILALYEKELALFKKQNRTA